MLRRLPNRSTLAIIVPAVLLAALTVACSESDTSPPATTEEGATGIATGVTDTVVGAVPTVPDGTVAAREAAMTSYFEPTSESFVSTIEFVGDGPFVMLNLYRLKAVPDFTKYPEMKPETPMTTRETLLPLHRRHGLQP